MASNHVNPLVSWGVLAVAVVLLALIVGPQLSAFMGASLLGPDRGSTYSPLVRHEISQSHCYDNGSQLCENSTVGAFSKEFTLGYLFSSPTTNAATAMKSLYGCMNSSKRFSVGTTTSDCQARGFTKTYLIGYMFQTPAVEASFPIYRCFGSSNGDTLVTDDTSECSSLGYSSAELLGYAGGSAYLPQQRLNDICTHVSKVCDAYSHTGAVKNMCEAQLKLCVGPK